MEISPPFSATYPRVIKGIQDGDKDTKGRVFDTLRNPRDITITTTDDRKTYALVTSREESGIQIIDVTNPTNPRAVKSIRDGDTDGDGGVFDTLRNPRGITTTTTDDGRTYALVTSYGESGIQIIDVTNPTTPRAVKSIRDDFTTNVLSELSGGVAATATDERVSVFFTIPEDGEGVQTISFKINEDDDFAYVGVGEEGRREIADGSNDGFGDTFSTLNKSSDIETVTIDGKKYVLISSFDDDGVQIMEISPPFSATYPRVIKGIQDGDKDTKGRVFDTLRGATGTALKTIRGKTYAFVTSFKESGLQVIDISNPSDPYAVVSVNEKSKDSSGGKFLGLRGARDIALTSVGGRYYVLVTSDNENSIQIIDVTTPSKPRAVVRIQDGDKDTKGGVFDTLRGVWNVTITVIDSKTYALATSYEDGGVQIIDITNPTTPLATANIKDGGDHGIQGIFGKYPYPYDIVTSKSNGRTYAFVTNIDGVQKRHSPLSPLNNIKIIDITDPSQPFVIPSDLGTLGTGDMTTINHKGRMYLILTDYVQLPFRQLKVIDITNPLQPIILSDFVYYG